MKHWKDILGFEGLYQINKNGDVKSLPNRIHSGIHLKGKIDQDGCNHR